MSDESPDTEPVPLLPIVALALSCEGLCEDDDAYLKIVDPAGPYAEEIEVAHEASSCMLFRAWLKGWRGQFKADTIQNTLRQIEGGTGRVPDADSFCEVGAGLWWEANLATHADEHVDGVVLEVVRHQLELVTLVAIAGGQRNDKGRRCIKRLTRVVAWDGVSWRDQGAGARKVRGVLDDTVLVS